MRRRRGGCFYEVISYHIILWSVISDSTSRVFHASLSLPAYLSACLPTRQERREISCQTSAATATTSPISQIQRNFFDLI